MAPSVDSTLQYPTMGTSKTDNAIMKIKAEFDSFISTSFFKSKFLEARNLEVTFEIDRIASRK